MKFISLKRKLIMPFMNHKRRQFLYNNIMTPEEIQQEEKKYHDYMLEANKKGYHDKEREYMYKRDALRKVLKINV